ncbi:cytochrome P450 [Nocardia huaxiensis]|uniref:cytochrome P450 n=1 Tax=Nocardia huaxiensis TaxID=2755382 RepID=UPI001E32CE23|nr:cytochrome P450 [Nocardia huaxiensis]UFS97277.1 cytochrome P450 [Nocardia huaxiensis]
MTVPSPIAAAPYRLPLLGHMVSLLRDPLRFLNSLPAHGDLVRVGLGPVPAVAVCDPRLTQELLRRDRVFDKGGPLLDRVREMLGDGLVTCPYSMHRRHRRLAQPAFHPARTADYAAIMTRRIDAITGAWRDGQVVDMKEQMHALASAVTAATLFSHAVPQQVLRALLADVDHVVRALMLRTLMPAPLLRVPTPGNRAYERAIGNVRSALAEIIAARRAEGVDHGDLLSALIAAQDEDGGGLSDLEISDQVITFFVAGTETTGTALAWALCLLDQHPAVADRLRAEVEPVLGGRAARYQDLPDLPWTGHVITEALRLRPPVWFVTRAVSEDTELGGHRLAAGTTVMYSAFTIQHRADLYPEPERFDPGRWADTAKSPARADFLAFAGGARKCIGETFARTEMTLTLATIIGRWRLRTVPGNDSRPTRSSTLQPRQLRMRVSRAAAENSGRTA